MASRLAQGSASMRFVCAIGLAVIAGSLDGAALMRLFNRPFVIMATQLQAS